MWHKDHSDANDKSYIPQLEKSHSLQFKPGRNPGYFDSVKKLNTRDIIKKLWSNRRLRFWLIISVIVFKVLLTLLMFNLIRGPKGLPENIRHEGIKGLFASAAGLKSKTYVATVTWLT